ncbi:MAG TPA: isoprenylcysteine carboxylmethyltransferase family protein [Candidatus Eisenbacteria bacterium]|nr:isoprenylcysteine carboxylmethyltransferase family protein [Candidatus Eisenbacteria bacterium]
MATLALVLWIGGAALVLGVRGLAHRRRTGHVRFAVRPDALSLLLVAGVLTAGLAGPVAGIAGLPPLGVLDRPLIGAAGVVLVGLGLVAMLATPAAMGDSWAAPGIDQGGRGRLITSGPFSVVRNPVYTSTIAAYLGLLLMVPNGVELAGFAAILIGFELVVRVVEEPGMRRVHGVAYERYATSVGRFVPFIGRIREEGGRS